MDPQVKLQTLYEKHWASLESLLIKTEGLSGPTLMYITDKYYKSPTKLMIIGQQTFGWPVGDIEKLMNFYREFNFGEKYYSSPFWNITKKVTEIIGISRDAIAWTNLVKCDLNETRPSQCIEDLIQGSFPVLEKEIEILSPDIIIFFTGNRYDQRILSSLSESSLATVDNYEMKLLTRVVTPSLPFKSFRTYHPKYLRMSKKESVFLDFINKLVK